MATGDSGRLADGGHGVISAVRVFCTGREVALRRARGVTRAWLSSRTARRWVRKTLKSNVAEDSAAHIGFRNEELIYKALEGVRGVPRILGAAEGPDSRALILEQVDGVDLKTILEHGKIPLAVAFEIIARTARILGDCQGVIELVHADVKPANIMVDVHGNPWLIDFGGASAAKIKNLKPFPDDLTPASKGYIAPERAHIPPVAASDVFGLGIVAKEVFGTSRKAKYDDLTNHLEEQGLDASQAASVAKYVVDYMQAREPEHRPTAAQVAAWFSTAALSVQGPSLHAWAKETIPSLVPSPVGPLLEVELELEPPEDLDLAVYLEQVPSPLLQRRLFRHVLLVGAVMASVLVALWGLMSIRSSSRQEHHPTRESATVVQHHVQEEQADGLHNDPPERRAIPSLPSNTTASMGAPPKTRRRTDSQRRSSPRRTSPESSSSSDSSGDGVTHPEVAKPHETLMGDLHEEEFRPPARPMTEPSAEEPASTRRRKRRRRRSSSIGELKIDSGPSHGLAPK